MTGPATGTGDDQLDPPLSDVDISSKLDLPSEESVPIPNTYVRPLLSVRIVQPSSGLRWPLLAAAPTAFSVQVLPPSVETATRSCAGAARPLFSWPWNLAQQMYTLPKYQGSVPIGPFDCGVQGPALQLRADQPVYVGWSHVAPESKEK